ncbi:MAG: SpoIIE family protein phosphatase [Candidatus Eisenbacteria bacterium]|nr:SpoIIE family protein phosphatase [Candidatus Eisenbacteria bacterium]
MAFVLTGEVSGKRVRFPLRPGRNALGRSSRNDIDLQNPSVSRQHAELEVTPQGAHLRDLGSSNGSWVNGQPVTSAVALRPGDRLRLGDQELRFEVAGEQGGASSVAQDPGTIAGVSLDEIPLSDPGDVSTGDRISWEVASSEVGHDPATEKALFRAVTEAGQMLVGAQPLTEMYDDVLGIVEGVVPARRILLLLTDTPDGTPAIRAARTADADTGEKLMLSRTIVRTVLGEREALLLNDALSDPRFRVQESIILQKVRSAMVAPLFDSNEVIGLLYADSDDPRVHYNREQLRAFTLLANLIAVKISNARLLEVEREQERMAQEVAAARQVQQTMLPSSLPQIPGYEILARQLPCFEVAGDLYDVCPLRDGRVILVVGDVTGKGMPAALLMSNTIAGLRVLYPEGLPLDQLAARVHQELLDCSDTMHFVTLFIGILDPSTHTIEYVNGGHNAPLMLCGEQELVELKATGTPLGLLRGSQFALARAEIPADAMLCIFSDGIPEAQNPDDLEYGDQRLIGSARRRCGAPLEGVADGVLADLRAFIGARPLEDDVTLILLRRSRADG